MEASELRIGNLVNYTNGGIFKVIGIHDFGLDVEDEIEITYMELENFEPIPLTEEWLVKLGFYKNIDTELFEKGGYQIDISVLKCHFYLPSFGDWYKELEHVHQLQNLYWCLCGEELKIKHN